jgi:Protein of unknown function (DUF3489)
MEINDDQAQRHSGRHPQCGFPARRRCRPAVARDLKLKGGAVDKVLGSLQAKGLIEHQGAPRGDDPPPLRITCAGLEAIGVEAEERSASTPVPVTDAPKTGPGAQEGHAAREEPQPPTEPAQGAKAPAAAKRKATVKAKAVKPAKPGKAAPADRPSPRAGTKQARMIELLQRPEGATVEQIAAATGWQKHTIRGAISGALKKKLGLKIEPPARARSAREDRRQGQHHRLPDRRLRQPR